MNFFALLLANEFHRNVRCGTCGQLARYAPYIVTFASLIGAAGFAVSLGLGFDEHQAFHPQRFFGAFAGAVVVVMVVFALAKLHPAPAPRKKSDPLFTWVFLALFLILVLWYQA